MADFSFVSGHHTATLATKELGSTDDGFQISHSYNIEPVRIDALGDTIVDGVYRGYNVRVSFTLSEWNAEGRDEALHFFDSTATGTLEDVGQLAVANATPLAKELILTRVQTTTGQFTYTFKQVIPDGDHGVWNLNNRLRVVRCNFLALPDDDSGLIFTRGV